MAKRFDATTKQLVDTYPADWLGYAGLPAVEPRVVDADLSSFTLAADKVIRVGGPDPYIGHIEFEASAHKDTDTRMLVYNVVLRPRHELPVRSVLVLLRPQAQSPRLTGRVLDRADPHWLLDFRYRIVRAWEQPPDVVLAGGLGAIPMAPLGAATVEEAADVIRRMRQRLDREARPEQARSLWAATFILLGLRYEPRVARDLLAGVRSMKESSTYQAILEEGAIAGRAEGKAEGKAEEARALLLRLGRKMLGAPRPRVAKVLQSIDDVSRLESLVVRLPDVSSWAELLAET